MQNKNNIVLLLASLIMVCMLSIVKGATCDANSCGISGKCVSPLEVCLCGSNNNPSGDLSSCDNVNECNPQNISASNSFNTSVFDFTLDSSAFGTGKWNFQLSFASIFNSFRNVKILSKAGAECSNMLSEFSSSSSVGELEWSQSSSSCTDLIVSSLTWADIASCIQNPSEPNKFEAFILVETSVKSQTSTNSSLEEKKKRKEEDEIVHSSGKEVSFEFAASTSSSSNDTDFYLRVGSTTYIKINVTGTSNKRNDLTCVINEAASALSVPPSVFVFPEGVDVNSVALTSATLIVLDSSAGTGEEIITRLSNYLNENGSLICDNLELINQTITALTYSIHANFKVVSFQFNPSTLKLELILRQKISSPLVIDSSLILLEGNTTDFQITMATSPSCDFFFCSQDVKIEFDASNLPCSGFINSLILTLGIKCNEGTPQMICDSFTEALNNRKIVNSFGVSAEWCPIQQRTELLVNSFKLFEGEETTEMTSGKVLETTRNLRGEIEIKVTSQVQGSVLDFANISSLVISDGNQQANIDFSLFPQLFTSLVGNDFTVKFNHTIDPSYAPNLNFNNSVFFIASIDVFFGVPNKRNLEKKVSNSNLKISLSSSSYSFKIASSQINQPTSLQTETPSNSFKPSSKNIVAIIVGSVGGAVAVALVVVAIILFKRNKSLSSSSNKFKDEEMGDTSESTN